MSVSVVKRQCLSHHVNHTPAASDLFNAIQSGNFENAKQYFESGGQVNVFHKIYLMTRESSSPLNALLSLTTEDNWTEEHAKIFLLLVEKGADVNESDADWSLLHKAVWLKRVKFIELLLKTRLLQLDIKNQYDSTPLMMACHTPGTEDIMKMLIQKGADVNHHRIIDGSHENCLSVLIRKGSLAAIELFLKNGADPNFELSKVLIPRLGEFEWERDEVGPATPTYFAFDTEPTGKPFTKVIECLIEHGARIDEKCTQKTTPAGVENLCLRLDVQSKQRIEDILLAKKTEETLNENHYLLHPLSAIVAGYLRP